MTGSCARRDHRLQLRRLGCDKEETMSDFPAVADRVEIEALRGEFTDAAMMRDYDRLASLFTQDAVWRIPVVNVEFVGREEIRAGIERLAEAEAKAAAEEAIAVARASGNREAEGRALNGLGTVIGMIDCLTFGRNPVTWLS
jgi:hypothetical protein